MADLSLSVDEDEELLIDSDSLEQQSEFSDLCLIGRLLTDRPVNFMAMKTRMADIWRPGKGVSIRDVGEHRYLFQFYHVIDMRRVLDSGPWSFDNQILLLHHLKQGELPSHVPLTHINFWVQVYDLPLGYMSEKVGKQLGDFVGKFLEYDCTNNSGVWRSYMRLRVAIDVCMPLKRYKKIRRPGGDWFLVNFKYERLGSFCFVCGCLGHTERFCEKLFSTPDGDIKREWGIWLRAPDKRNSNSGTSRWLREDNHTMIPETANTSSGDQIGEKTMAGEILKTFQNPVFSGNQKATLSGTNQGPLLRDSRERSAGLSLHTRILPHVAIFEEDSGLELSLDRKRTRVAHTPTAQSSHMDLDGGNKKLLPNAEENDDPNQSFLLAGPGLQACQDQ